MGKTPHDHHLPFGHLLPHTLSVFVFLYLVFCICVLLVFMFVYFLYMWYQGHGAKSLGVNNVTC